MNRDRLSRRDFLGAVGLAATFTVVPRHVLGGPNHTAPSEKLNIASVGVGGMGGVDINQVSSENIVALCDVDLKQGGGTFKAYPKARRYRDFRKMLEKEDKNIDAVTVSTPDNTHAVAAIMAIKMGKHVYCQKPLCHDVYEVRKLTEAAREHKVMTQMGTQLHAESYLRQLVEMIKGGVIGNVRRVDLFSDKNWGGGERPSDTPPVPETLDWGLWLGPARYRPYHPVYAPGNWRRWWDFGTGTLGDMGCHIIDPAWWALGLKYPTSIEADCGPFNDESYPQKTIVTWEFPARGDQPPVTVRWFDGSNRPPRPKELEKGRGLPGQGGVYYGDEGVILAPHGGGARLIPESRMKGFKPPEQLFERGINHWQEWIRACKGGPRSLSNFDYAGPLTEAILLGNLAAKAGQKLLWNGHEFKIENVSDGERYLKRTYRTGWTL
ncbi:MAG: Gfo/Idh/MocA family oxidoreductase [Phycisphaerales bacterium]|nr:MAG: Gfo/Idh/MocA family oxidoreductase [Phycisphaerales bacterium]